MGRFKELGAQPVGSTPEDFDALIRRELTVWADVVRRSGAQGQLARSPGDVACLQRSGAHQLCPGAGPALCPGMDDAPGAKHVCFLVRS